MVLKFEACQKTEWALQRGGHSAHSFSWLLSSPQQPLETEDPPTVSLAPQYASQHLCRAIIIFLHWEMLEKWRFCSRSSRSTKLRVKLFHCQQGKNFSIGSRRVVSFENRPPKSGRWSGLIGSEFGPDHFGQGAGL